MADRVELAFRRAAASLIPPGTRILVAVSGGGDSVALLHLIVAAAPSFDWTPSVAHLDHGLRRGSRTDRRFVERLARELGLTVVADRREVTRRRDESPEEAARRVRRRFLIEARSSISADRVALGHTLDDQAETVLMRLVRGAGATALAGMAHDGPRPFVRPLLGLERSELRSFLDRRGLPYRDDPTNSDLRFDRNRVRRLLLPGLAEALNPRAARHLVRAADRLRADALLLDSMAAELWVRVAGRDARGRVTIDARELSGAAEPLASRACVLALREAGVDARRITSRHIEGLLDLAEGGIGRELSLPGGRVARVPRRGQIRIGARGR